MFFVVFFFFLFLHAKELRLMVVVFFLQLFFFSALFFFFVVVFVTVFFVGLTRNLVSVFLPFGLVVNVFCCIFRKTDVYAEAMGAPVAAEEEDGAASSIGRAPQKWSARGKEEVQHPLPVNGVSAAGFAAGVILCWFQVCLFPQHVGEVLNGLRSSWVRTSSSADSRILPSIHDEVVYRVALSLFHFSVFRRFFCLPILSWLVYRQQPLADTVIVNFRRSFFPLESQNGLLPRVQLLKKYPVLNPSVLSPSRDCGAKRVDLFFFRFCTLTKAKQVFEGRGRVVFFRSCSFCHVFPCCFFFRFYIRFVFASSSFLWLLWLFFVIVFRLLFCLLIGFVCFVRFVRLFLYLWLCLLVSLCVGLIEWFLCVWFFLFKLGKGKARLRRGAYLLFRFYLFLYAFLCVCFFFRFVLVCFRLFFVVVFTWRLMCSLVCLFFPLVQNYEGEEVFEGRAVRHGCCKSLRELWRETRALVSKTLVLLEPTNFKYFIPENVGTVLRGS